MTEKLQIYKCQVCGNIVEMIHEGKGKLICCGKPMELFEENTTDAVVEKHVPVIKKTDSCIKVNVGSIAHPMEEKHYIEWIELIAGGKSYRQFLKPGDLPNAEFCIELDNATVRAYCNIHGLWKG
ncbi:MAG: desulfoferrodoxin [Actinobacteria bacterium]|nr:desulfoferrodoxin [Actinomycetota bacterium]MBL7123794.1 desulfoferrodoxin [Actinomycetota bacterium]